MSLSPGPQPALTFVRSVLFVFEHDELAYWAESFEQRTQIGLVQVPWQLSDKQFHCAGGNVCAAVVGGVRSGWS